MKEVYGRTKKMVEQLSDVKLTPEQWEKVVEMAEGDWLIQTTLETRSMSKLAEIAEEVASYSSDADLERKYALFFLGGGNVCIEPELGEFLTRLGNLPEPDSIVFTGEHEQLKALYQDALKELLGDKGYRQLMDDIYNSIYPAETVMEQLSLGVRPDIGGNDPRMEQEITTYLFEKTGWDVGARMDTADHPRAWVDVHVTSADIGEVLEDAVHYARNTLANDKTLSMGPGM